MKQYNFLSIQSCVSFGHVGNSAVTFPLQRLGVNLWPIHTVLFSNHTGYGSWRGSVVEPKIITEIVLGLSERSVLEKCDALLTGYMGSVELGAQMIESISKLKSVNPKAVYCLDPVMGDVGRGFFVKPGIPEFFKNSLLPLADIMTPNHFELEYLAGEKITNTAQAVDACRALIARGPKLILVTSFQDSSEQETIDALIVTKNNAYKITTPKIPVALNGTGDLTAALFTYFYLSSKDPIFALEQTISRLYAFIEKTYEEKSSELLLIKYQDFLVNPPNIFKSMNV